MSNPKNVDIRTLRKNVYSTLLTKQAIIHSKTYQALQRKYYELVDSKKKLHKFHTDIQQYTANVNTKGKLQEEKKMVQVAKVNLKKVFRSNQKVVSFYVTLYRPKTDKYKGKNALLYDGEEYVPLSASNMNGLIGSFFFSKKYSIGQTLIMRQLGKFEYVKADDFKPASGAEHALFAEFDGYDDFISAFENFVISQHDLLLVMTHLKIDETMDLPINYASAEAFDDADACPCVSVRDYIQYSNYKISTENVKVDLRDYPLRPRECYNRESFENDLPSCACGTEFAFMCRCDHPPPEDQYYPKGILHDYYIDHCVMCSYFKCSCHRMKSSVPMPVRELSEAEIDTNMAQAVISCPPIYTNQYVKDNFLRRS
jgi:hypothetical protein